jgi:beta-lactamase class A
MFRGFMQVCVPGGMLFDARWVYFCLTINRYVRAAIDVETVNAFTAAGSRALTMAKEGLSA